jgi:RNase H-like domain found in reverse transcriptase
MYGSLVLTQPDFKKWFYLQMGALAYSIGAILLQEGENPSPSLAKCSKPTNHPVAYYSATFTPTE